MENRGEIRPQIANHVFCMGLAEKSCNVSTGSFIQVPNTFSEIRASHEMYEA